MKVRELVGMLTGPDANPNKEVVIFNVETARYEVVTKVVHGPGEVELHSEEAS